jgi:hypothetical protein
MLLLGVFGDMIQAYKPQHLCVRVAYGIANCI